MQHTPHATKAITLTVNGKERLSCARSLGELLEELGLEPDTVVAELNGSIIAGAAFAATVLQADDTLELIRFVGGG